MLVCKLAIKRKADSNQERGFANWPTTRHRRKAVRRAIPGRSSLWRQTSVHQLRSVGFTRGVQGHDLVPEPCQKSPSGTAMTAERNKGGAKT